MQTKRCCRCARIKPINEFHKSARGVYGVHSICKECKKIYMREYAASGKMRLAKQKYKNTDKGSATIVAYRKSYKNKEIQRRYRTSAYGRSACVHKLAKYRAVKSKAMPVWTDADAIKSIYNNCPKNLEVDHIIPLQNELVCGLHVPWNLQYLSRKENAKKSNQFDGTYDNNGWRD